MHKAINVQMMMNHAADQDKRKQELVLMSLEFASFKEKQVTKLNVLNAKLREAQA